MRCELRAVLAAVVLALAGCLADAPVKAPYDDTPRVRADGWVTGTPASQGLDPARLRRAYERLFSEDALVPAVSLLVVRHGVLVAEGYCRDPADIDRLQPLMSATKSVTSLLFGMARDRGLVELDAPLAAYLPDAMPQDARARDITPRHLLTMRSGLDYPNDRFSLEMEHQVTGGGARFLLSQPFAHAPGEAFVYQDTDPQLLAAALQARLGTSLEAFAREALFAPLGITRARWLADDDGVTYGPFGLALTPRDLARLGQLVLQGGAWQGRQLVSRAWLEEATRVQVPLAGVDAPTDVPLDYGFYWWVDPPRGGAFAWGHGGQVVWVEPARDLVVVLTAEPDTRMGVASLEASEFLPLVDLVRDSVTGP